MKILAVETSGLEASIALAQDEQQPVECVLDTAGRRNARLLIPAVDQLLKENGLEPPDIDAVAVSVGPGSFTGLRVGIVFAKTFAWINDAALIAVDTLQAIAQRVPLTDREITVISDAQRGDVFVNMYRHARSEAVQPLGTVSIEALESVIERLRNGPVHLLTGPAVESFPERIPSTITTAPPDLLMPRATALLPAAREAVRQQAYADIDRLEPVYLRRSYAEEKRDVCRRSE